MIALSAWEVELLDLVTKALPDPDTGAVNGTVGSVLAAVTEVRYAGGFEGVPVGLDVVDYTAQIFARNAALVSTGDGPATDVNGSRYLGFYDGYSFILEFMSVKENGSFLAQRNTNGSFFDSKAGFDEFTWVFLEGARATNLKANGFGPSTPLGELGEGYNNTQYHIRYGEEVNQDETIKASNRIAALIAQTVVQTPDFPTLWHLGQEDGQRGARELWFPDGEAGIRGIGREIGGWAGTPFFLLLREPDFFQRDILHYKSDQPDLLSVEQQAFTPTFDETDAAYQNTSAYDLLSFTQAFATVSKDTSVIGFFSRVIDAYKALDGASSGSSIPGASAIESIFTAGNSLAKASEQTNLAENFIEESYGSITNLPSSLAELAFGILGAAAFRGNLNFTELTLKAGKTGEGVFVPTQ